MRLVRLAACTAVLALVCQTGLVGQEKKADPPKESVKYRGQLPQNWKQLSLSDEQKQTVYKIQTEYGEKVAALEKQIKDLKDQQKKELEKVLTDEQKANLRKIIASKVPGGSEEKKKDDKDK